MTKSGGEIAQGKAKDAGGLTPAKDDNAALRDCYSRTFAGNSDDCYNKTMVIQLGSCRRFSKLYFFRTTATNPVPGSAQLLAFMEYVCSLSF